MTAHPDHPARAIPTLAATVHTIDDLTRPERWKGSPFIANRIALDAAYQAYRMGRRDARVELLTADDVAVRLGITPAMVRRWARELEIGHPLKHGETGERVFWLFTPEDIEALDNRPKPGHHLRKG